MGGKDFLIDPNYRAMREHQASNPGSKQSTTETWDNIQTGLTVGGMTPVVGIIPDALNTGISAVRTGYNWLIGDDEATQEHAIRTGMNAGTMVPAGTGQGIALAKLGWFATKGKAAKKTYDKSKKVIKETAKSAKDKAKKIPEKVKNIGNKEIKVTKGKKLKSGKRSTAKTGPNAPTTTKLKKFWPWLAGGAASKYIYDQFQDDDVTDKYKGFKRPPLKQQMGGYMSVPQGKPTIPGEGSLLPKMTNYQAGAPQQTGEQGQVKPQYTEYDTGGTKLDGGVAQPIGGGAVQFLGQSHEEGGIKLDEGTEVEGGETMDKVTMKGGGQRDYFFSSYMKKGGLAYSDIHKNMVKKGASQEEIDWLAKLQEADAKKKGEAGRDPDNVAKHGGVRKHQTGDFVTWAQQDDDNDGIPNSIDGVDGNQPPVVNASNNKNQSTKNTQGNRYPVASEEFYDSEVYGDVADYQPSYKTEKGDMQYYLGKDEQKFKDYISSHDNFGEEWMSNVDPAVLEKAGITSYDMMNDPATVKKYQTAWNELHTDNKITVDGKFGEQTLRTAIGNTPPDDGGDPDSGDGETTEDTTTTTTTTKTEDKIKTGYDDISMITAGAQLLPAMMAFKEGPDYMQEHPMEHPGVVRAERISKHDLERIDMNTERARNSADYRALTRAIDTSGGGPTSMSNRMMAYSKKQQGDREISAQESRANVAIANQEAIMNQERKTTNAANALDASKTNLAANLQTNKFNASQEALVDEFNRSADAATKDRKLMAVDSAVKTLAGMNSDRLQYNAQERLALAIKGNRPITEGDTSEEWVQNMLTTNQTTSTYGSSPKKTGTSKDNTIDSKKGANAKKGGFAKVPQGYSRKYY